MYTVDLLVIIMFTLVTACNGHENMTAMFDCSANMIDPSEHDASE